MPSFRKYAIISTDTSASSHGQLEVRRISWLDLQTLDNLADYDAIIVDLAALGATPATHVFANSEIDKLFDLGSWVSVLEAGGVIFVIGEPATECFVPTAPLPNFLTGAGPFPIHQPAQTPANTKVVPLQRVLTIEKDRRPFDFRRIIREEDTDYANIYRYLDQVRTWDYSLRSAKLSVGFVQELIRRQVGVKVESIAHTTFRSFLAANFTFSAGSSSGYLTLLPGSGREPGSDPHWVLREFLSIDSHLTPPQWVQHLNVPGQQEIDSAVAAKKSMLVNIEREIGGLESDLARARDWLRLLYDDGFGLEEIVQRTFEALGAKVTKPSKEKDDYRLNVDGYPEGVLEVKGTHNARFAIGSLRQLANWVDEALEHGANVKGIFVGNAARTKPVRSRDTRLFEVNSEKLALLRGMAVIRTADLFCVTILALLGKLEVDPFWEELFNCQGRFDASPYWAVLPKEYQPS